MKRRGFFKFLSIASATYFIALLDAKDAKPLNGISYAEYSDAGKMPRYEGFVPRAGSTYEDSERTRMWRFDRVSGMNFKCHNCDKAMLFSREDFRQHGQTCNQPFGEQS